MPHICASYTLTHLHTLSLHLPEMGSPHQRKEKQQRYCSHGQREGHRTVTHTFVQQDSPACPGEVCSSNTIHLSVAAKGTLQLATQDVTMATTHAVTYMHSMTKDMALTLRHMRYILRRCGHNSQYSLPVCSC